MLAIKFWDAKWFKDKLIYNMCYILAPQQHVFYLIYIFLLIIQVVVPYHCVSSPKSNYAVLNSNHSYFLLVDNGTVGKYGGEIIFRKRLERFIAQQKISISKSQTLQILSSLLFSHTPHPPTPINSYISCIWAVIGVWGCLRWNVLI